jgi:hypothetical protein
MGIITAALIAGVISPISMPCLPGYPSPVMLRSVSVP